MEDTAKRGDRRYSVTVSLGDTARDEDRGNWLGSAQHSTCALFMKPRIFLSSTFSDLHSEREVVLQACREAGWEPVYFATTPDLTCRDVLTRVHYQIRSADVFLNLLASRYGSQVPELPISYTHFEFALARWIGKPLISLALSDADLKLRETEWRSGYAQNDFDLLDLRHEITLANELGECLLGEYSTSRNEIGLKQVAVRTLREARNRYLAGEFSPSSARNSTRINQYLERRKKTPPRPGYRYERNVEAKLECSQYFWDFNLPLIAFRSRLKLFFGDSATTKWLLAAMMDSLQWTKLYGRPKIDVLTNAGNLAEIRAELMSMNCTLTHIGGELRARPGTRGAAFWLEQFARTIPRPKQSERALFVCGSSMVPSSGGIDLVPFETLHLLSTAYEELGYSGLLFFRASEQSSIQSFNELGKRTNDKVPLAICIATGSKTLRDAVDNAVLGSGFEHVPASYSDEDYGCSFPLIATNAAFRKAFGRLIG